MKLRRFDKYTLLKLLLAAVVLVGLVRLVDLQKILAAAVLANPYLIAAGVALLPINLFFEALLWHRLVREVDPQEPFSRSFASLLVGNCLGAFTPARAGEWAGRALYLPLEDKWQLALMTVAHRIMDLAVVLVMGVVGLLFFRSQVQVPHDDLWLGFAGLGTVVSLLLLTMILLPHRSLRVLSRLIRSEKRQRHFSFLKILTPKSTGTLLFIAWMRYIVYTGQFLVLVLAFAPRAPLVTSYAAIVLVMYAKFIVPPVTFADIGVRESASVLFFGLLGVSGAAAFDASILVFCINLLLPAAIGFPLVMRLRLQRSERTASLPGAALGESIPGSGSQAEQLGSDNRLESSGVVPLPIF